MKRVFLFGVSGLVFTACAAKEDNGNAPTSETEAVGSTSADGGGETFNVPADSTGDGTGQATPDESSGGGSEDTGPPPGGRTFFTMPDGGGVNNECDQWSQDCPKGEKCMPYSSDGGGAWNATRCVPIAANPGQVGDTCTVEGGGTSGVDDCDIATMCYYVDPETQLGTCVGMCQGTPEAPVCDPGFLCSISNDGVLTLCRRTCDPLVQDCEGTNVACLPAAGALGFVCIVDASGDAGATGDACEFLNACDPGHFCAAPEGVPGCLTGGCCSEFCDLLAPDPDSACTQADQGVTCEPWFAEGEAPPDWTQVGACVLPV